MPEKKKHKVRIVTAASLFDGHDAAINIMRRIMQSKGAEIIHLGHNRSVHEIVECAIEEDADSIAITSYQGGHLEFFKYMKDLLIKMATAILKFLEVAAELFCLKKLKNWKLMELRKFILLMMEEKWVWKV